MVISSNQDFRRTLVNSHQIYFPLDWLDGRCKVKMIAFSDKFYHCLTIIFLNLLQKIDQKVLKTTFFWCRVLCDLNDIENENLTQLKQGGGSILSIDTVFQHFKMIICTNCKVQKPQNHEQKLSEKLWKLGKSCHHKQNINRIYSE